MTTRNNKEHNTTQHSTTQCYAMQRKMRRREEREDTDKEKQRTERHVRRLCLGRKVISGLFTAEVSAFVNLLLDL